MCSQGFPPIRVAIEMQTQLSATLSALLASRTAFSAEPIITYAAHTSHQTKQTHWHTEMACFFTPSVQTN